MISIICCCNSLLCKRDLPFSANSLYQFHLAGPCARGTLFSRIHSIDCVINMWRTAGFISKCQHAVWGNFFHLQLKNDRSRVLLILINVMCGDVPHEPPVCSLPCHAGYNRAAMIMEMSSRLCRSTYASRETFYLRSRNVSRGRCLLPRTNQGNGITPS